MNDCIICLQARTSSKRLPAKSLLYICSYPLFVLAAKRAESTGIKTLVVTSTSRDDDLLAMCAKRYKLKVYRGSLDNVLERFVLALENEDPNKIIVRLTADNYLPDGVIIKEMIEFFKKYKCEYLTTNNEKSGLPHGCSVEVFRYKTLCEAKKSTIVPYDLEHVTPWIIRNKPVTVFEKYKNLNMADRSVTIDTYMDYCLAMEVLKTENNPETVAFTKLIENADTIWRNEHFLPVNSKLIIGGAQLGGDYGYLQSEKYTVNGAQELIAYALSKGFRKFDTAQGYGDSESNIGAVQSRDQSIVLSIQTKLSCLNDLPKSCDEITVRSTIKHSVHQTQVKLRKYQLDTMLLHRWSHWHDWGSVVSDELMSLKEQGMIEKIGVSIQNEHELAAALEDDEINAIQMPFNILDHRWERLIPEIRKVKKRRNLEITVRSVFLQGLLLSTSEKLWRTVAPDNYQQIIKWLQELMGYFNEDNLKRIAINYARSQHWIDGIIIGVETIDHINEVISIFSERLLSSEELKFISDRCLKLNENILNPALWKV